MSFTLLQRGIVYISASLIVFEQLPVESVPGELHPLAIGIDTSYNNINYKVDKVHDIVDEKKDKSNPSDAQIAA